MIDSKLPLDCGRPCQVDTPHTQVRPPPSGAVVATTDPSTQTTRGPRRALAEGVHEAGQASGGAGVRSNVVVWVSSAHGFRAGAGLWNDVTVAS